MKVIAHKYKLLALLTVSVSLVACGVGERRDLEAYVAEVLQRPGTAIEPLPEVKPYVAYEYQSGNLRSPFSLAQIVSRGEYTPDVNRVKEVLEYYSLDSLQMVGILERGGIRWVLIATPDNAVHRVTIGSYLGQNYGKIVDISEKTMQILETIPDGQGGWMQRQTELTLAVEQNSAG